MYYAHTHRILHMHTSVIIRVYILYTIHIIIHICICIHVCLKASGFSGVRSGLQTPVQCSAVVCELHQRCVE